MPRKVVRKPIEVKPDFNPEIAPDEPMVQSVEVEQSPKISFDVYNADGVFVRSYTVEIHGENAEALANEFAAHTGGKVV